MQFHRLCIVCLLYATVSFCEAPSQSKTTVGSALNWYDLGNKNPSSFALSSELKEISGVTVTDDGRLFAHQDESGIIYQLDPIQGTILKKFSLGKKIIREDFEDITVVKSMFYLITSAGDLYEFNEGKDNGRVEYKLYHTGLTRKYDIEGLCYDPTTNTLLLACKESPEKKWHGYRLVFSFSLKEKKLDPRPRFLLPLKELEGGAKNSVFKPSAIARHPRTGTFFVLAAVGSAVVEVSPDGKILNQIQLHNNGHPQPEGLVVFPNGSLLISDEGQHRGRLTRYPMKQQPEKSSR